MNSDSEAPEFSNPVSTIWRISRRRKERSCIASNAVFSEPAACVGRQQTSTNS